MPDDTPVIDENPAYEDDAQLDRVGKNIKQLKYGDMSSQVDALVILNETITSNLEENKESLVRNAPFLLDTISKVLYDTFDKQVETIPLKFGKYFIGIVLKVCSLDFIIRMGEQQTIFTLTEQLLLKLLTPGLEQLGEKKEGEIMFRNLNSSILRILENCQPTLTFCVFLSLLKKYKGCIHIEKLPGIIVKCLIKITRIIPQTIEQINVERVLLAIHEYLIAPSLQENTENETNGIKITKTIVNEIVRAHGEDVWNFYEGVDSHPEEDQSIKKWIEIVLKSLESGGGQVRTVGMDHNKRQIEDDFREILRQADTDNKYYQDQALKKLFIKQQEAPDFDLMDFLAQNYDPEFVSQVKHGLKSHE